MTTTDEMIAAHGTIVAALRILRGVAERTDLDVTVRDLLYHTEARIADTTPVRMYGGEPALPEVERTWSEIVPGDEVQAPNGAWYKVDATARMGREVHAQLIVNGKAVTSKRPASGTVMVRRCEAGRAVDMFRAAGILEGVMIG